MKLKGSSPIHSQGAKPLSSTADRFGSFPRPPFEEVVSIATSGDLIRRILSRLSKESPKVVESSAGFHILSLLPAGSVLARFLGRSIARTAGLTGD